jgi:hypothetical protein
MESSKAILKEVLIAAAIRMMIWMMEQYHDMWLSRWNTAAGINMFYLG